MIWWPVLLELGKRGIDHLPAVWRYGVCAYIESRWATAEQKWWRQKAQEFYDELGRPATVLSGPFQGMPYINRSSGSAFLPKILGTYEMELRPAVEAICAAQPDLLVDIGAAEGYYAVGLARRLPRLRVRAYEIYPPARLMLQELIRLNRVGPRVRLGRWCTPRRLECALSEAQRPVVICDCEGAEDDLILPTQTPSLARAHLLVELHEAAAPGIGARLKERLAPTHRITEYPARSRTVADAPPGLVVEPGQVRLVLSERGHPAVAQSWYFCQPLESAARPSQEPMAVGEAGRLGRGRRA